MGDIHFRLDNGREIRRTRANFEYSKLVRRCPLRPIRSEAMLDRAIAMIDSLLDRTPLSDGEKAYLDTLSDLVEAYETVHHPIPA